MSKPNRFAKSLQTMEINTSVENHQKREPVALPPLPSAAPATAPDESIEQGTAPVRETPPIEKNSSKPKSAQPKPEGKSNTSKKFDVDSVLDSLTAEQRNGKSITLYVRNEIIEQLDKLSQEKKISKSRILHAILEEALLK
jgi:hypothetical protein